MKNLIIVGTGGFAAELTEYIKDNIKHAPGYHYRLKGYLDVTDNSFGHYGYQYPLLGSEADYKIEEDDCFVVAIGIRTPKMKKIREGVIETLTTRGAKFANVIHHTVQIAETAVMGEGNMIAPFCIVGPKCTLGSHNILNYGVTMGHDCKLGDANIISPNVQLSGFVSIGNGNFFGISSNVLPELSIGDNNKIQAGLTVRKPVKDACLVFTQEKSKVMVIFGA